MSGTVSDFDAAKAVADQLKGMEKERQQRVLRWVAESLGIEVASGERRTETQQPQDGGSVPLHDARHVQQVARPVDIKSFVDSKRPKSDVQFATVVAYYYRFEAPKEAQRESIDAGGLQEAARLAGRRRPPSAKATLNNAKKLGYLDSADRGHFRINSVGENLVAMTLPGAEGEPVRRTAKRTRRAKPRTSQKRTPKTSRTPSNKK